MVIDDMQNNAHHKEVKGFMTRDSDNTVHPWPIYAVAISTVSSTRES